MMGLVCSASGSLARAEAGKAQAPVFGDVTLEYRPLPGCPDEAAFRERSADAFDFRDPFLARGREGRARMEVQIARVGRHYRGTIRVQDSARRELGSAVEDSESCDTLVWVLAHRVAMVIGRAPPPPAPRAGPGDAPGDREIERRIDKIEAVTRALDEKVRVHEEQIALLQKVWRSERRRSMNLTYTLSTGVLMTANLTSSVGPGVWAGGELRIAPLSMGIELRAVLPARVGLESGDFDLSQYVAYFTPCGRYSYFFGCAVVGGGAQYLYDSNFSPRTSKDVFHPLFQVGGRLGVEVPFAENRLAARVWGEMLGSLPPIIHAYLDTGEEWYRPDVSAFFGAGLVVKFGDPDAR